MGGIKKSWKSCSYPELSLIESVQNQIKLLLRNATTDDNLWWPVSICTDFKVLMVFIWSSALLYQFWCNHWRTEEQDRSRSSSTVLQQGSEISLQKGSFRSYVISKQTRYYQPDWLWWRYHVQLYIVYFIWDLGCEIWSIKIPIGQYRDNRVEQLTIVVVAQTHIGDSAFFTQGQQGWTFIWSHAGQIGSLPT